MRLHRVISGYVFAHGRVGRGRGYDGPAFL